VAPAGQRPVRRSLLIRPYRLAGRKGGKIGRGFKLGIILEFEFVCLHSLNYTLVTMARQQLQVLHHCVFSLHYHLVLITKYRRKVITKKMLERLNQIFSETLQMWDCQLIEFNGEPDHVHLLFEVTPVVQLSKLINNLKTVSSRLIRRDFKTEVTRVYRRKPIFWQRSYCIITAGGAPIEMLRRYIEEQETPEE
jgi:putative transposase